MNKTPFHAKATGDAIDNFIRLRTVINDWVDINAAAGDEKPKLRTFKMKAYTGGVLHVMAFYPYGGVVDLAGMKIPKSIGILRDHDRSRIVGHTTSAVIKGNALHVEGVISGVGPDSNEVSESSRNGFPWQASIGARVTKMDFVKEGATVNVNGKTFRGPLYIATSTKLGEVSFTALGADDKTTANVAANSLYFSGGTTMVFAQWLTAKGLDPAKLSDEETAAQNLLFDAEMKATAKDTQPEPVSAPKPAAPITAARDDDPVAEMRAAHAAERTRIAAIDKACGDHADIAAKAITEGWSEDRTQLEVLRAERPQAPAIQAHASPSISSAMLECATVMSANASMAEKEYGADACETVAKAGMTELGLGELLFVVAKQHGYTGRNARDVRAVLGHAFAPQVQASGFSNVDISGILSNVANKFLLAGFESVEDAWRKIAATRPVRDFKTNTGYRLVAGEMYEKVGPGGELTHGALSELDYSNKADTYGRMYGITRQDIINDDLGALSTLPRSLGRAGALKLNDVFWTEFMDNSTFFASGNDNKISDALASAGLTAGVLEFRKQTDPSGHPLGITPRVLLVPPDLEVDAQELYVSTNINTGGSSSTNKVPNRNAHAGKYEPVISAYLSNSSYTGYSTSAWYLLADPQDLAVIEVVFLNGKETPTVESADADFNTLGIQMRGYHDFGVSKQEYRAGIMSSGGG